MGLLEGLSVAHVILALLLFGISFRNSWHQSWIIYELSESLHDFYHDT